MYPHEVNLQLYHVHAVTEGTDAQATVSVRIEEEGKTTVGQAADTDTLVASANAYINALNKMIIKRKRNFAPDNVEVKQNLKTEKKIDKERFRKDLGNIIQAYQEVARRLGIMHEETNISEVNFGKTASIKFKKKEIEIFSNNYFKK